MYQNASGTLAMTGIGMAIWWPLAGFALLAAGLALWRIGVKRSQPKP